MWTIPRFSSATISDPANQRPRLGPGANSRHLKAVYCDELYRCLNNFFSGGCTQSEWSGPDSNHRLDFRIVGREKDADKNTTLKLPYGIQCSRDGDELLGHRERFLPGGDYWPYIQSGSIRDYALVDFRMIESRSETPDFTKCDPSIQ